MKGQFEALVGQSRERTMEATLGVLGINDAGLRQHLVQLMNAAPGQEGSFLAPPLFEHTFGWKMADRSLQDLVGELIHQRVFDALTQADNDEYRFPKDLIPYRHQLASWQTLLAEKPRSLVVTTGTGSGKTECFMVPILEDLVRTHEKIQQPLTGVRALFLYPLNALINSQRDRLKAWVEPFGADIRFCLYNGMTEENESTVRRRQSESPSEVLSRERLRREPPPILMTNATMLEYMLVRQVDSPILERSRAEMSLKWIVLDEAHTYIGSQAAELSLLLRRVMEAFGVEAESVRFVATSATLAGEAAKQQLATYLSGLAGISKDRVTVVDGERQVPQVPLIKEAYELGLDAIRSIEPEATESKARYDALSASPTALTLRTLLTTSDRPPNLVELAKAVVEVEPEHQGDQLALEKTLGWLDVMTGTVNGKDGDPFVRLRIHIFQRMLHGLWSCVNPACEHKTDALERWPFGLVHVSQRAHCTCGDPVFEVGFCDDCKQPHLITEEIDGFLRQPSAYVDDEFSLLTDTAEDEESENNGASGSEARQASERRLQVLAANSASEGYQSVSFDLDSGELGLVNAQRALNVNLGDGHVVQCSVCGFTGYGRGNALRKCYLGAPFYVSNAVPTVLEFCPDALRTDSAGRVASELPAHGRKLITFTDSRQGTARMAVRMQQEAERSRLRGLVFSVLRDRSASEESSLPAMSDETPESLLERAAKLREIGEEKLAEQKEEEAARLADGGIVEAYGPEVSWNELAENLASDSDIQGSILSYNRYAHPELFQGDGRSSESVARLLLAREYARRPKNANSTESLGLVRVGYRGLDKISKVPEYWSQTSVIHGVSDNRTSLTLDDWKHFLKVALDFYVRENTFLRLSATQQRWMGSRFAPKTLLSPDSNQEESGRVKRWPLASRNARSRLVKLLACGAELDSSDSVSTDLMDTWLRAAWSALCDHTILTERGGWALDLSTLSFSLPRTGWVCPITQRVLDTTFLGLTPYLPRQIIGSAPRCRPVELPQLTKLRPAGADSDSNQSVRRKVASNSRVAKLRADGLWSDISDRVVEGGFYYRTAEHSAQQSQTRLQDYEDMFRNGQINVLNCSTTMEMGVDIGGVSAVVMNNVPPHPANYLQRAGRAGRRNEARSVAYTLCRNQPHDRRAFAKPEWPFVTPIPSPNITLESRPLVRRHVHSFFLARFLRDAVENTEDRTRLTVQWFFGADQSRAHSFVNWLLSSEGELETSTRALVRGTALESEHYRVLAKCAGSLIEEFSKRWTNEEQRLVNLEGNSRDTPYGRALAKELERHREEYLLRDLTVRGFLPGYGFPIDVVTLKTYNFEDFLHKKKPKNGDREDNIFNYKEQPSRGMAVALREYAPGAQIVVDGRVYRCAGVSLHWHTPGVKAEAQALDIAWHCRGCGKRGFLEKCYSHESIDCNNCGKRVLPCDVNTVLQPAGFVTDFFETTTNDVTSQTFIEAQRPDISIDAEELPLADPRCGTVRYGSEGHVFVHSAGEFGKGYAVCLRCGKADSMSPTGDAPRSMPCDDEHKPVGGEVGSSKERICAPEGIQYSILLGHRSRTDVLELMLRNPGTQKWLGAGPKDGVVASTIALALREAIADRLGIASLEIGYGYRQDKDQETGAIRAIPQVYDTAVGGAGFVIAGAVDLVGLLETTIQKLCCRDNCENVCPGCLAGSDGRVEAEPLDRPAAKRWFEESEFLRFLRLPDVLRFIDGTVWWSHSPARFIEEQVRGVSRELVVVLCENDCDAWSFDSPELRRRAATLQQEYNCSMCLLLPIDTNIDDAQREELRLLEKLGVEVSTYDSAGVNKDFRLRLQSNSSDGTCHSLVSLSTDESVSESRWLDRLETEILASTTGIKSVVRDRLELGRPERPARSAEVIELTTELNGPVRTLPERFMQLLDAKAPVFSRLLADDPVVSMRYDDRYLSCPWNVVLLAGFLKPLVGPTLKSVKIVMGKPGRPRGSPTESHDDWQAATDMKDAVTMFLERPLGMEPTVDLAERKEISHRRTLILQLLSGQQVVCSFDQGMGYWWMTAAGAARRFDFGASSIQQSRSMRSIFDSAMLKNSAPKPTDLTFHIKAR